MPASISSMTMGSNWMYCSTCASEYRGARGENASVCSEGPVADNKSDVGAVAAPEKVGEALVESGHITEVIIAGLLLGLQRLVSVVDRECT